MQELRCKKCGSLLEKQGEMYMCPACGAQYETENARRNAEELFRILDEQKQEAVANLRAQLWRETQEEYINDSEISRLAKEVKRYLPDDYFANFCSLACGNNDARLNAFLGKTDVSEQRMFVWDVLRLMLHLLKEDNLLAVNDFLSRVGNVCEDTEMYDRYNRQLIREAEKIDKGVYDVQLPRDAFIAYKSEDMEKVIGLVEELERQGLKCFVAARNLQHGAMRHYEEKLYEAMDHCKAVVFVSSLCSRSRRCDALRVELPYIRQKDVEVAPAKFRNYYEKMPSEYKKPRVEYVIEPYKGGDAAEDIVNEFFAGYERCYNVQEVARRVLEYVASAPVSNVKYCVACGAENGKRAKFCSECGGREFVSTREEREEKQRAQAEQAIREAEAVRKAEEDRRRAEEEKKKATEAQKRAEEEKKKAEAEAAALRAELERLKAEAAKSVAKPAVPSLSVVQAKPSAKFKPAASSIEGFEIKDGVLVKYKGKSSRVAIPNDVTSIGEEAFRGCYGLTSVTISNGVSNIGDSAFSGCSELKSITIPKSVVHIGKIAFSNCNKLTNITVEQGNSVYHSDGNCLIETKSKKLIVGCENSIIPTDGSVTSIGSGAFWGCIGLTNITIPSNVIGIERYTFFGCTELTGITIPLQLELLGVKAIPDQTKIYCHKQKPEEYPKGWDDSYRDRIIWDKGKSKKTRSAPSVQSNSMQAKLAVEPKPLASPVEDFKIKDGELIKYKGKGGDVVIPQEVKSIWGGAFKDCSSLASIRIPKGVTGIGCGAFEGCSSLTSITVEQGNPKYHSAGNCLIETPSKNLIVGCKNSIIPSDGSVTSMGAFAFAGCSGLTGIKIPNGVTSIGAYVFKDCSGLKSITVPCGVKSIEVGTFKGCRGIKSITIPNSVTAIGERAFECCTGLTSVTISNNVTSIEKSVFESCMGLTSITLPSSVTSIKERAFYNCSALTSITIPNGVKSIGTSAFEGCSGLIGIAIPDSVTIIDDDAFKGCSRLTSIAIPNGITSIETFTFEGCSGLTSIILPNEVTRIEMYAFADCSGLTNITIPDGVKSIGTSAFEGCSGLEEITIPPHLEVLGAETIPYQTKIYCHRQKPTEYPKGWDDSYRDRIIWDSEKPTVAQSASAVQSKPVELKPATQSKPTVEAKTSVQSKPVAQSQTAASPVEDFEIKDGILVNYKGKGGDVVIPNGVRIIEASAFYGFSDLTNIMIPNSVKSIKESAFSGCSGLTRITIPNGVESIGGYAFSGCNGLTSITIPNSVESIGLGAFSSCSGLISITTEEGNFVYHSDGNCLIETKSKKLIAGCKNSIIPSDGSVTSIGMSAFEGCSKLTKITIPNSVTSIGSFAFDYCSGLKEITIPNSVTGIGTSAFKDCSKLTKITIPNGVTKIEEKTFSGCSGLISITLPNGISSIEKFAFSYCGSLTSITIPNSATSIGSFAFDHCSGLKEITIPNSVTSIGGGVFLFCSVKIYCHRKKPLFWPKDWDKSLKNKIIWDK